MYLYIHTHIYVYIYVHIYTYICIYLYQYINMHRYIHITKPHLNIVHLGRNEQQCESVVARVLHKYAVLISLIKEKEKEQTKG